MKITRKLKISTDVKLQVHIVICTGQVTVEQLVSICISLLSVTLAACR